MYPLREGNLGHNYKKKMTTSAARATVIYNSRLLVSEAAHLLAVAEMMWFTAASIVVNGFDNSRNKNKQRDCYSLKVANDFDGRSRTRPY